MEPILAITRPDLAAQDFADALEQICDETYSVVLSPAYKIEFIDFKEGTPAFDQLIFTSTNGVAAAVALGISANCVAWCVGPRTAETAKAAGFEAVSANGASDDLVKLITENVQGKRLLHVSGRHIQSDISEQLGAFGIKYHRIIAYEQTEIPASMELRRALMGRRPVVLPLFSKRAPMVLEDLEVTAPLFVIAMSETVSDAVRNDIAANYIVANEPNGREMLRATCDTLQQVADLESPKDAS